MKRHIPRNHHTIGSAVIGGALPTPALLQQAMQQAGMIDPTHDQRQADLEVAFGSAYEGVCPDCNNLDCQCDPEQQEWVISGTDQP